MTRTSEAGSIRGVAFRSRATGAVIATGSCHDLCRLPGGLDADLDEWEAGFVDGSGRFMDRREAALAAGHEGRLEARAYFGGDPAPTLEAGHVESWRAPGDPERASEAPPDPDDLAAAA